MSNLFLSLWSKPNQMKTYTTLTMKLAYLLSHGAFFEVPTDQCDRDATEIAEMQAKGFKLYCFKPRTGAVGTISQWAKNPSIVINSAYLFNYGWR